MFVLVKCVTKLRVRVLYNYLCFYHIVPSKSFSAQVLILCFGDSVVVSSKQLLNSGNKTFLRIENLEE